MQFKTLASAAVVAAPLASALPMFSLEAIPDFLKSLVASKQCTLPGSFEIENFQVWTPAGANGTSSSIINFAYWDSDTQLQTICHYNSSSVNVAPAGYTAARYACEDPLVQFIYQVDSGNKLTMIEETCPDSSSSSKTEASGEVQLTLSCIGTTTANSTVGVGRDCFSNAPLVTGNFTSLQPVN